MSYATYEDFKALYGGEGLGEADFDRLSWEAERLMDDATTGVDGVRKLRAAMPKCKYGRETVKRCACALVDTLRQIDEAAEAIRKAQSFAENADGTLQGRVITSRSAGGESISYAAGSAASQGKTAAGAAVGDLTARQRLMDDTVRRYLSGVPDANGVNLLYMGSYPAGLGG